MANSLEKWWRTHQDAPFPLLDSSLRGKVGRNAPLASQWVSKWGSNFWRGILNSPDCERLRALSPQRVTQT